MNSNFIYNIQQKLQTFALFREEEIFIDGHYFSHKKGKIGSFIYEIEQTALALSQQEMEDYAEIYASKLIKQFEILSKAIENLKQQNTVQKKVFVSPYSFPKNIHSLPLDRRLNEYKKALRALNDKISWLVEAGLSAKEEEKFYWQQQIAETEYRKQKCLKAIEELEEKLAFKQK